MRIEKLRINDIRYNPEREGFEALVTVHDAGLAWRYPSFVPAPMHAEFKILASGLTARAIAAHRSNEPGMRMHLRPLVTTAPMPSAPAPQEQTFEHLPFAA
ncbi:hypothetical protein [Rhodalgimonas zhirmunskyi]|uniref:Uncharacterized protein n=1 Tax=Rhodalgimonas zhirmunskyi TaxID=2964767 RepID=A0AAJ1X584_9RHOB|nr:hypothetical protein [Rhodoalgimonas zhirmunskyi]MDQ2093904.1 hypothetical protein [Rhodoalgimonas zhirmunskyi]